MKELVAAQKFLSFRDVGYAGLLEVRARGQRRMHVMNPCPPVRETWLLHSTPYIMSQRMLMIKEHEG